MREYLRVLWDMLVGTLPRDGWEGISFVLGIGGLLAFYFLAPPVGFDWLRERIPVFIVVGLIFRGSLRAVLGG